MTLLVNANIEKNRIKADREQKKAEVKREKLTDVYAELVLILNSFPKISPNNVLKNIEGAPHYSMESFDSIIDILNYQIEDYKRLAESKKDNLEEKCNNEIQIGNREYAINQIHRIKDEYCKAHNSYKNFCKTKKQILDLYAGQDVRNNIVEFDVLIHNVFISGHNIQNAYDLRYNEIEVLCRNIINSMRDDIALKL